MWQKLILIYSRINPRSRAYSPLIPVCVVLACGWAAYKAYRTPVRYFSTGRVLVSGRMNLTDSNTYMEELNNFIGTQIETIRGDALASRARQAVLDAQPNLTGSATIEASWLKGTAIFLVNVTGTEPRYTEAYLNALLQQYIESRNDRRIETSLDAMQKLREEIVRVERALSDQETELFRFKEQHNMAYWGRQSTDASQYLSELKIREADLELKVRLAESVRADPVSAEAGGVTPEGRGAAGAGRDTTIQALRRQILERQVEREQLLSILKPAHPRIKALDQETAKQQRLLAVLLSEEESGRQSELIAMRSELASVRQSIQDWEKKALESTRTEAEHEKLQSSLTRTRELYSRLINNLQSVTVGKEVTIDPVQILQRATPATEIAPPFSENLRMGLGLGLLSGVGLVLLLGKLDPRAFSEREISDRLGTEAIVEIPTLRQFYRAIPRLAESPPAAMTESVRTILSSLHFRGPGLDPSQVVVCLSSIAGEGKSTIAMHLAAHAAEAGLRTLLVDSDLRRGQLADRLGFPGQPEGMAELLDQPSLNWSNVVRKSSQPRLDFISRGAVGKNTMDQLGQWLNPRNLAELRAAYDLIVIDAAPLGPISDSKRFLSVVDRVLFVTRVRTTPLAIAERVARVIRAHHPSGFDLVINNSSEFTDHYGYYDNYRSG